MEIEKYRKLFTDQYTQTKYDERAETIKVLKKRNILCDNVMISIKFKVIVQN